MKLPTKEEFELAARSYLDDGPQPMAAAMEENRSMVAFVRGIHERIVETCIGGGYLPTVDADERVFILVKSLVVLGLNIGIRIGENRR